MVRMKRSWFMLACLLLTAPLVYAGWSGPVDVVNGKFGNGRGEVARAASDMPAAKIRVEKDNTIVVTARSNNKTLIFSRDGKLLHEEAGARTPGPDGLERATKVTAVKNGTAYTITVVFQNNRFILHSDREFAQYVRDGHDIIYGISPDRVRRFPSITVPAGDLVVPRPHEELLSGPDNRAARIPVYVEYGEPALGPDGAVYLWKQTDTDYGIVKWTWSSR